MGKYKKQIAIIAISVLVIITSVVVCVYIECKRPAPIEQKEADKIYQKVSEKLFDLPEDKNVQSTYIPEESLSYVNEEYPTAKQDAPDKVTSTYSTEDYKDFKKDVDFQPESWEPYDVLISILNSPVEDLKDIEKGESLNFMYVPNSEKEGFSEFMYKYLGSKLKEVDEKYPCEEGLTRWYSCDVIPKESCSEDLPYREGYTLVALTFRYL